MDKTTRQMINENIEDLNNIVKQLGLGDTYRTQHLTEKKKKKTILLLYTGDTEKHKTVWKKLKYFKINRQPVFISHKTLSFTKSAVLLALIYRFIVTS